MLAHMNQMYPIILLKGHLHVVLVLAEGDKLVVGVVVSKDGILFLYISHTAFNIARPGIISQPGTAEEGQSIRC